MKHYEYPVEAEIGLVAIFTSLWAFMFLCVVFGWVV